MLTFELIGTDPAETDQRDLSPLERWDELDCADAYSDALNVWQNYDPTHDHYTFSQSMADTFHFPTGANCGKIGDTAQCNLQKCSNDDGTGPAASEIWNSFVYIHDMYSNYFEALNGAAATTFTSSLASFENTFAPVPPPKQTPEWEEILIAIVTLGASLISAPFFNSIFKTLPLFTSDLGKDGLGVFKDFTSAFITFGSNIAKDTVTPGSQDGWTASDQADFSAYLGQVVSPLKHATGV